MNGSITIESEPGMGTRFVMSFPLTLAIIPAIMVKVRKEMYAVPLSDVIETIKISSTDITTIEGHEVINLRGEILSLLRLNQFVGIESGLADQSKIPVVVVGYGNRKIGLIVDQLEGKQEIVIKSLEQNYTTVSGLAGASILGDGSICLILDISSMISRVISEQEKLSREQRSRVLDREASVEKLIEAKGQTKNHAIASAAVTEDRFSQRPVVFEAAAAKTPVKAAAPVREAPRPVPVQEKKPDAAMTPVEKPLVPPASSSAAVSAIVESVSASQAPKGETTPVAAAINDGVVDDKVREALDNFKSELETNISNSVGGKPDDHIKRSLSISDADLKKIQVLANVGITHGAESLSRIINKRVDLAIPEVKLLPIEKIPDILGGRGEPCIGVFMPLTGDMTGTVLLSLPEVSGFELIDGLFGLETGQTKEMSEDGESALKEITNIVGSSVVNAISEKTGLAIMPDVPVIKRDFMEAIIDGILGEYNIKNDYALIMDTEFYYQDDRVMGNLLILPDTASLKGLVEHLNQN
jgi:two-component system chemotaxis sensor kinase CheA